MLKKLDWSVLPVWLTCAAERGSGRAAVAAVAAVAAAGGAVAAGTPCT